MFIMQFITSNQIDLLSAPSRQDDVGCQIAGIRIYDCKEPDISSPQPNDARSIAQLRIPSKQRSSDMKNLEITFKGIENLHFENAQKNDHYH